MRKLLLAFSAAAVTLSVAPVAPAEAQKVKTFVCTKWKNGVCVSTHRVKGVAPFEVGHVFGKTYVYTPFSDLPQPVVVHNRLDPNLRYVYRDGYVYVVDPATYAVTRVLDVISP